VVGSFHIQFAYNGTYFKGEVFPLEKDSYRVEYKTSGLELKPKIVIIKRVGASEITSGSWLQMEDHFALDEEFIDAIGREVESSLEI
jgi:hypothetical protein